MKSRKPIQGCKSRRFRILKYSAFTVLLTGLIVTGYYLISNGIIFGKYVPESPYIEQSYVDNPDSAMPMTEDELTVTAKNSFSSLKTAPVLSGLPEVPNTDGTVQKGTKDNPLVILEIVPELAQQSLSFLVATPDEGLPFNPIDTGREVSNKKNSSLVKQKGQGTLNNVHVPFDSWDYNIEGTCLRELGGWFNNNNNGAYTIYNPNGTVIGANHKTKTRNDEGKKDDSDRTAAPWAYLSAYYTVELKRDASFASEIAGGSSLDSRKKINDLKTGNTDFVDKDGNEIPDSALQDDLNWAWSYQRDTSADESWDYTVKVDGNDAFDEDVSRYKLNEITFTQLAEKYPDSFLKGTSGQTEYEIRDIDRQRADSWKLEKEGEEVTGYLVYVGAGQGDFKFENNWTETPRHSENAGENTWKYVEKKEDLPENYKEIWPAGQSWWGVNNKVFNNTEVGAGFPVSHMSSKIVRKANSDEAWLTYSSQKSYTFRYQYKYEGYIFKFEYIGLKINDILKRMLFWYEDEVNSAGEVTKTADEKYDDTYIKMIAVTPSMINEMDEGDTAATLDYVERADMFFVSSYYCDEGQSADGVESLLSFYYDYVDPERDTNHKTFEAGKMASFYENDLEWVDCMKIIRRLSGDPSLPMMFSKQMGYMLDEGVKRDGTKTSHMYVTDTRTCQETPGSLSNLAKLYLICTQYDLSAKKEQPGTDQYGNQINYITTFMEDIYDNIKQVPIAEDSTGERVEKSAKNTGFFKRSVLADCGADLKEKENAYYLWNIYTFIPIVSVSSPDSLFNGVELNIDNFLKYGFLESSIRNPQYQDSIKNGGGDYSKIDGTKDPENDYQNVTIGGNGSANSNFVIFDNGVMAGVGEIIYDILNSGAPLVPTMKFDVLNTEESRNYYQRLGKDSVLIDYSQSAQYKTTKDLQLHCSLDNAGNEETSILTKVTLKCSDESKNLTPIVLTPKRIDGAELTKQNIDFSQSQTIYDKVNGYAVEKNDKLRFLIPFTVQQWQQGYDTIRVDWVARSSKDSKNFIPYQNPIDPTDENRVEKAKQYAEVTIGERGLFALQ